MNPKRTFRCRNQTGTIFKQLGICGKSVVTRLLASKTDHGAADEFTRLVCFKVRGFMCLRHRRQHEKSPISHRKSGTKLREFIWLDLEILQMSPASGIRVPSIDVHPPDCFIPTRRCDHEYVIVNRHFVPEPATRIQIRHVQTLVAYPFEPSLRRKQSYTRKARLHPCFPQTRTHTEPSIRDLYRGSKSGPLIRIIELALYELRKNAYRRALKADLIPFNQPSPAALAPELWAEHLRSDVLNMDPRFLTAFVDAHPGLVPEYDRS